MQYLHNGLSAIHNNKPATPTIMRVTNIAFCDFIPETNYVSYVNQIIWSSRTAD